MRISSFTFIFLAWLGVATFSAGAYATDVLSEETVGTELSAEQEVGVWDQAVAWVLTKHHELHHALKEELQELRSQEGIGWMLVLMSFLYGVLHAAGPGHGKAVLTTYLLTHRSHMNRGIAMGTAAALLQGVTALILVYGLIGLADRLPREAETASMWASRVSFILLVIIGLYVLVRSLKTLAGPIKQLRSKTDHNHNHNHNHEHVHGESCGCRHLPTAAEIDATGSRHADVGVILAIGLRPCSGAVLVLILASMMDLMWHGAFAVLAMSVGTAITVVVLAMLATMARNWASTMVAHRSPLWALAGGGVGVLGGALLLLFGLSLLSSSFAIWEI